MHIVVVRIHTNTHWMTLSEYKGIHIAVVRLQTNTHWVIMHSIVRIQRHTHCHCQNTDEYTLSDSVRIQTNTHWVIVLEYRGIHIEYVTLSEYRRKHIDTIRMQTNAHWVSLSEDYTLSLSEYTRISIILGLLHNRILPQWWAYGRCWED